jgi:hypothetical protein
MVKEVAEFWKMYHPMLNGQTNTQGLNRTRKYDLLKLEIKG